MRFTLIFLLTVVSSYFSWSQESLWTPISAPNQARSSSSYFTYSESVLKNELSKIETLGSCDLDIPLSNGTTRKAHLTRSSAVHPALLAKYPSIQAFEGYLVDDPSSAIALEYTEHGITALVLADGETFYLQPTSPQTVRSFRRSTETPHEQEWTCSTHKSTLEKSQPSIHGSSYKTQATGKLKTYRLAVACTGEYATYHGGTVSSALAAIVSTINRVNIVYKRELSIVLQLIPNNDKLIYTNGTTDPFSNNNGSSLLNQIQDVIDAQIGFSNYDIGHVFSTGGGGVASLASVCYNEKAQGVTGSKNPVGDAFDIDYVCHEMGHQFAAEHTFNGNTGSCSGNKSSTSYEPGSGTTIMAYAGICSTQNIQPNSNDYFHIASLDQIKVFINGSTCGTTVSTTNTVPTSDAGTGGKYIPKSTPFMLTGKGYDEDNDAITYCWEQFDIGEAGNPNTPEGNAPLFRSFSPTPVPTRVFPAWNDLLNNTQTIGEKLPSYARPLTFMLTVRDNNLTKGGQYAKSKVGYNVTDLAGPFTVSLPNSSFDAFTINTLSTIYWDVSNTNLSPVNCNSVDIWLSVDGGNNFDIQLADAVPNSGSYSFVVPNKPTTSARVMIKAHDNIFFDISDRNFTIKAPTSPDFIFSNTSTLRRIVCDNTVDTLRMNSVPLSGFGQQITYSLGVLPDGINAVLSTSQSSVQSPIYLVVENIQSNVTYPFDIVVKATSGSINHELTFSFTKSAVLSAAPALITPSNSVKLLSSNNYFSWSKVEGNHRFELSESNAFSSIVFSKELGSDTSLILTEVILKNDKTYYWRVGVWGDCSQNLLYSPVGTFSTFKESCTNISSINVPVIIPEGDVVVFSNINVDTSITISDLNITLSGTHKWVSDMDVYLISPDGTESLLFQNICDTYEDFDFTLDDEAISNQIPCPPIDKNSYEPFSPLSVFDGLNSKGTWKLKIADRYELDAGKLLSWSISICGAENSDAPYVVANNPIMLNNELESALSSDLLNVKSNTYASNEITYHIIEAPLFSKIRKNDTLLTVNSTFTQSDIDNGKIILYNATPTATNEYISVVAYDKNGLSTGIIRFNIIGLLTAIDKPIRVSEASYYPNPVHDMLTVLLRTPSKIIHIQVLNNAGQAIWQEHNILEQNLTTYQSDVRSLPTGFYILSILTDQGSYNLPIIKE